MKRVKSNYYALYVLRTAEPKMRKAARIWHLQLLLRSRQSQTGTTATPLFHRRRQDQIDLSRFVPLSRLSPLRGIRIRKNNGSTILILDNRQVDKMAECLPRICESMCGNEQYECKKGDIRPNTTRSYRIARLYLGKQYIGLRLGDLQYLSRMFRVHQNQLKVYTLSLCPTSWHMWL